MDRTGKFAFAFMNLAAVALGAASAYAAGTLPAGYTEVEYIQGSGNARLVTDYTPAPNTDKFEAVVEWPSGLQGANHAVWCARGNGTQADSWTLFAIKDNAKFRYDYMPSGHAVSLVPDFTIASGKKYTITAEDNTVAYAANGAVLQTQSTPAYSFAAGSVLVLFASHYNGVNSNKDNFGKHRLYSFKVWRSGELIHYFVPCRDGDGNATMADICANPATLTREGTFTAGDAGHYYDDSQFGGVAILPIPRQVYPPGVTPEPGFTVTNFDTGASWTFAQGGIAPGGCPFEASYDRAGDAGTVTATGKAGGDYAGVTVYRNYSVSDELLVNGGFEDVTDYDSGNKVALARNWTPSNGYGNNACTSASGYSPNNTTTFITGTYCAVIDATRSLSQVFTNDLACVATLSWKCKHRTNLNSAKAMFYWVLIDGEVVHPVEETTGSDVRYRSVGGIVLTPGEHTLTFQGRSEDGVNQSLFVDDVSFRIQSASSLVILPIEDQIGTGSALTPSFVVSNTVSHATYEVGGGASSELFDVAYTDNTASGFATATVTGKAGGIYEGMTASRTFRIYSVYHVTAFSLATEGDGLSWASPMSLTNALAVASTRTGKSEVWLALDKVEGAALTVTNTAPLLAIRGGFAGTERSADERPAGTLTVLDGTHAVDCLLRIVSTNAAAELELDRLQFCNARANGVVKTGVGSLKAMDCVVAANGLDSDNVYGRGMNVQGGSVATLVVSNCTFAGNVNAGNYGGFGLYLKSLRSALVEDSLFVTNGVPSLASPRTAGTYGDYARGSAIYSDGVPVTVRGCRFAGNRGPLRYSTANGAWGGGVVMLNGACGGSLIDHCVFIGNTDYLSSDVNEINTAGALVIYLANTTDKVKVQSCTFAYNLTQATYQSAGGITAVKGDVEVVNTILWKNKYSYTGYPGYGSDVQVKKDAKMTVRNSIVTTLDGTGIVSANAANLTIDADTVVAADPKLVTTTADYDALVDTSGTRHYYKTTSADAMVAMDAHLLSPAGYVVNGGAAGPATAEYSRAIDFGDPAADYSNEPAPNGSRLNAGAYGNTAEASLTTEGQPNAAVDISFPDGMTRPLVQVTMGLASGIDYHGTVHLVCSTGDVVLVTKDWDSVVPGDVLTFLLPYYLANGDELTAVATVVAPGATTVGASATEEANGSYPGFYGKGGGPNVIHVRPGADCLQDGTSWTDAFANIPDAMKAAAADPSKTEMWIAGPIVASTQPASVTLSAASFRIRGGFAGVENDESERVAGAVSTLDGVNSYRAFYFANANPVFFERLLFTHGSRGSDGGQVYKSGAGDVTFADCIFKDNLWTGFPLSGLACFFTGSSSATVSITNCLFDSNRVKDLGSNGSGHGRVIFAQSLRRLAIDGCTFVSNGCDLAAGVGFSSAGRDRCNGSVICANGAPVTARNCEFRANRGVIRSDTGGIIRLGGASYPSAFTNCLFIGNADTYGESLADGNNKYPYGGTLLVCYDNAAGVCDLDQCTFAYNISDAKKCCAGIQVVKGRLHAHNTILFGNKAGPDSEAPGDMLLWNDGTATLDYVRLTGEGTYGETASSVISTNAHTRYTMNHVTYGDPSFATTRASFESNIVTKSTASYNYHYFNNSAAGTAALLAFDAHLRSKVGMFDNSGAFVWAKGELSDAIDAGDPKSDYSLEPERPGRGGNGHRANLGAYGNTKWASMSHQIPTCLIFR